LCFLGASQSFSYSCQDGQNWSIGNTCYLNLTLDDSAKIPEVPKINYTNLYITSDLEFIPTDILKYFPLVIRIVLDLENMQTFPSDIFQSGNNVQFLKIMESQIKQVNSEALINLNNLIELDFYGNPITYVDASLFEVLKELKILDLRNTECADSKFTRNGDNQLLKNCTYLGSQEMPLPQQFLASVLKLSQSEEKSSFSISLWSILLVLVVMIGFFGFRKFHKRSKFLTKYDNLEASENTSLLIK
jgi:hypothetical protein